MKCLYLACTPLQIINATEARDRFHADSENFLVVAQSPRTLTRRRAELNQMLETLIDDRWTRVWNLKLSRITQLLFPMTAASIRNAIGTCENIYTGGFQTQLRQLINTVAHRQLVVVDGGAGCTSSALARDSQKHAKLYRYLPGMRVDFPSLQKAKFFTSYELNVEPQRVIRNDYRMLKEHIRAQVPTRDEIVFISQPLERDLNIRIDTEQLLQHAMQHHGVSRYRHILHPREKRNSPQSEHLPYLVELFAMQEKYLPKAFVTFMSSAARNIQLIYDLPVTCYNVLPLLAPDTTDLYRRELEEVYRDFEMSGLEVLPIPETCAERIFSVSSAIAA